MSEREVHSSRKQERKWYRRIEYILMAIVVIGIAMMFYNKIKKVTSDTDDSGYIIAPIESTNPMDTL